MTSLIEHLQEQGYDPDVSGGTDEYELLVSGIGSVRIWMYPDSGYSMDIWLLDAYMVCEWQIHVPPNTPDAVALAIIEVAENQLADKRGGPVTPAQVERA